MSSNLFFSVVIPSYNRAAYIRRTIETVLKQDYKNFEVIVVDDGSTDNTEEVVSQINHTTLKYFKIANAERGAARNYGVRQATGDYITFLDSDDELYFNYLSNANNELNNAALPEFFHQAYEVKDSDGIILRHSDSVPKENIEFLIYGNLLSCIGVFIKKEVALMHPFKEDRNLSGSEDWELWLRLAANYGLKTSSTVCSALIAHDKRSVLGYNEPKLVMRKILALEYAFEDNKAREIFGKHRRKMEAYCDTYISLHLTLSNQNAKGLKYLFLAFTNDYHALLSRRTLAIFKYMAINLLSLRRNFGK